MSVCLQSLLAKLHCLDCTYIQSAWDSVRSLWSKLEKSNMHTFTCTAYTGMEEAHWQ
jgi:hypothetical protein